MPSQPITSPRVLGFLQGLGLKDREIRVYVALLKVGNGTVRAIAREANIERTTCYSILINLRGLGLAASYKKNKMLTFTAVSPERLNDLLQRRVEDQQQLQRTYAQLVPDLLELFRSETQRYSVKQFEGINSLPGIYWSMYQGATHSDESLEFTNWGGKYALFPAQARQEAYAYFKKHGIVTRSILVEDDVTKQWKGSGKGKEMAKDIRLIKNPGWDYFVNMEMCRDKIALVTYRDDVHFQGIVIESPELAAMFRLFFETLWHVAE